MAASLGHTIQELVPSLFTFHIKDPRIEGLQGISVPKARVWVPEAKLESEGPLLITHWGMSGPAVLKLSAWGARELAERNYGFTIQVNWIGLINETEVTTHLNEALPGMVRKKVANACPFTLPKNLWLHALDKAGINPDTSWSDLGKKLRNRLLNCLLNDTYVVAGKTTFKEEFVTCGGVTLGEVDFSTMQSRIVPGLHFAGEVLDVDGITGGFNFQAAWTTGFIAGSLA